MFAGVASATFEGAAIAGFDSGGVGSSVLLESVVIPSCVVDSPILPEPSVAVWPVGFSTLGVLSAGGAGIEGAIAVAKGCESDCVVMASVSMGGLASI